MGEYDDDWEHYFCMYCYYKSLLLKRTIGLKAKYFVFFVLYYVLKRLKAKVAMGWLEQI